MEKNALCRDYKINNSKQCMKELLTSGCQSLEQAAAWDHAGA